MAPGLFVQPGNAGLAFLRTSITSLTGTPWRGDHTLPVYVSIASAAVLLFHVLVSSKLTRPLFAPLGFTRKSEDTVRENTEDSHIQRHGGRIIFASEVVTLISSLELLRVALLRVFAVEGPQRIELTVACVPFAYTTLLALFTVVYSRSTIASGHISVILATSWTVYFIRNVIPLMTYTESPLDPLYMLWELMGVLSFTGVLLPIITPRSYVPFNRNDPMPPAPSQTASWLSLTLFGYLDPTVWLAYKVPHLPLTDLPPLADSDHAKNLVRAAFPYLDPFSEANVGEGTGTTPRVEKKARSIFRAILIVFSKDVLSVTLLLLAYNGASLLSPYGLKKLLEYLENREGATVKPWVWIASLFVAPFASILVMQQYQMVLARATVHLEAILTQLILQHALRIRVIAEGKSEPVANTGTHTPVPSTGQSCSSSGVSSPQPETESGTTAVASESDTKAVPAAASADAQKS
ncbi:ATP-binding cassette transporter abc4, partial [Termitomyces sp. T112]